VLLATTSITLHKLIKHTRCRVQIKKRTLCLRIQRQK